MEKNIQDIQMLIKSIIETKPFFPKGCDPKAYVIMCKLHRYSLEPCVSWHHLQTNLMYFPMFIKNILAYVNNIDEYYWSFSAHPY